MAQNPATFFVAIDEQENKNDENVSQSFNDALQTVYKEFKSPLLELPNITAISTKAWKSQDTTVIIARLDTKQSKDWKLEKCPEFLEQLNDDHKLIKNKPKSMVTIYKFIDIATNKKPFEIEGKEIYLCIQESRGSRQNSISSLGKPTNVIKPTNKHKYAQNEDQEISESLNSLKINED
mmetsp:Transcript_4015/g.3489  ORF Transcript_4015/g.3489 Transcript_4015/m.3489 type:complete len:179 (+) Transcript_4015:29-565(+)